MTDIIRQTLTPSSLNALARDLLETSFTHIWVKGEISNLSRPGSGHLYFTLKDAQAQLQCALFRHHTQRLRFQPRDGMLVLAHGKLTIYGARGTYQLVLDQLEDEGEGALRRAYEELYRRLNGEGLFDQRHKQDLPLYPRRIAIITSATGAVINDICSVLQRRFPMVAVDLLPTPVQGEGVAAHITDLLTKADKSRRYSVVVLARGGGSLEDLWPFNDEALARCVAQLATPCVSAIGHETDFCLCDFAADRRAPTPSVAAELLVPDQRQLTDRLQQLQHALRRHGERAVTAAMQRADTLVLRLQASSPKGRTALLAQRQTHAKLRLLQTTLHCLEQRAHTLHRLAFRLESQAPAPRIAAAQQRLHHITLAQTMVRRLDQARQQCNSLHRALEAISPLHILARGYTLATDAATNQLIRASHSLNIGQELRLRFADGHCDVIVRAKHPAVERADEAKADGSTE